MRKHLMLFVAAILLAMNLFAGQAKYVFYFIGDGMGLAEVIGTEYMMRQVAGDDYGVSPLRFASFPYAGFITTYSHNSNVTDSSAAGTALACGQKTDNGVLGMLPDRETPIYSVASWAHAAGRRVGVMSSVGVNHATPAAFYGHRPSRSDYYQIGEQLPQSGFDFFGGSEFLHGYPEGKPSLVEVAEQGGYTVVRGKKAYEDARDEADKMVMLFDYRTQDEEFPYAIEAKEGELTLAEMTESAVDFLMKKNKGFFLMVEGGKIDHGGHSNDAAATFGDVIALDDAVKVAYEFYKKHPKETLIVVTADHETGGLSLSNGRYDMLARQKHSKQGFSAVLNQLRHDKKDNVQWEDVKAALQENFGFWTEIPVKHDDEMALYDEWYHSFATNEKVKMVESLYYKDEPLSDLAVRILNAYAHVGWATGGHTGIAVPIFAVGAGAEAFTGQYDNTEVPRKIAKAAGYKVK